MKEEEEEMDQEEEEEKEEDGGKREREMAALTSRTINASSEWRAAPSEKRGARWTEAAG